MKQRAWPVVRHSVITLQLSPNASFIKLLVPSSLSPPTFLPSPSMPPLSVLFIFPFFSPPPLPPPLPRLSKDPHSWVPLPASLRGSSHTEQGRDVQMVTQAQLGPPARF